MESDKVKGLIKLITAPGMMSLMTLTAYAEDLTDALRTDTVRILSDMGIESGDFAGLFDVTANDLFETVFGVFKGNLKEPLRFLVLSGAVALILSLFGSSASFSEKNKTLYGTVGGLFSVTVCIPHMADAVSTAVTAVSTAGAFMTALIPVLAAAVAASGGALMSVFWQSAVFAASQTVSSLAKGFMSPCCGLIMGIGILDSLSPSLKLSEISDFVKKTALWVFSLSATLFTAFLSLKGVLAGGADSLTAKGAKLLIGSLPVVGSQLSEAYSSVVGSLSLVKSGTAVFGIASLCACVLPSVSQLTLWILALKTAGIISSVLGQASLSSLMKSFSSALTVLNMCVVFVSVLFIISIGIILAVRSGT